MEAYKKIFKHIEKEVISLSYSIEFDETQKGVYSIQIADLILRAGSLIESVIKSLAGQLTEKKNYDDNKVIKELKVQKKIIIATASEYKIKKKVFFPFVKNEERYNESSRNFQVNGDQQYGWNNAYQSLKHNFVKMIPHYGSVYYLFEILSALAVLLEGSSIIFTNTTKDDDGNMVGLVNYGNGIQVRQTFKNPSM